MKTKKENSFTITIKKKNDYENEFLNYTCLGLPSKTPNTNVRKPWAKMAWANKTCLGLKKKKNNKTCLGLKNYN